MLWRFAVGPGEIRAAGQAEAGATLAEARRALPPGLAVRQRCEQDAAAVVETWL